MSNLPSYILFGLALALAVWTFMVWRGFAQNWLPSELAAGKVAQVERNLFVDTPFPVVGRPDQVYRLPDGLHVPLENKNRDAHRVYETDIAQLSLQAWLLRLNGLETAPLASWPSTTGKPASAAPSAWNCATTPIASSWWPGTSTSPSAAPKPAEAGAGSATHAGTVPNAFLSTLNQQHGDSTNDYP